MSPVEPTMIVLRDSEWLRGTGSGELLHVSGKRCCIGIACKFYGVPDILLKNRSQLQHIDLNDVPLAMLFMLGKGGQKDFREGERGTDLGFSNNLYTTNDTTRFKDNKRLERLNSILITHNADFRFVYDPDH